MQTQGGHGPAVPAHPQLSLDRENTFPEPKLLPPTGRQHSTATLGQHLMSPLQREVQAFHTSVHQGRAPSHTAQGWPSPHPTVWRDSSHCLLVPQKSQRCL